MGRRWGDCSCAGRYLLLQFLQARFVRSDTGLECVMNIGVLFHKPHTGVVDKIEK